MNRSMLICATLPLALVVSLSACSGDDGPSGTGDDETGITTTPGDGDGDQTTGGDGDGDSTTTGDGDGDASGDGDGDKPDCGMVSIAPEYVPPNVMLVVDASGSMVSNSWDHDLNPNTPVETRWMTLYGVVETILGQFGASMNAGVQRFPSEDACDPSCTQANACNVSATPEVSVAFNNGAAILAALPPADDMGASIEGATPATKGINSAVAHLQSLAVDVPRYILFITDGAASCTPGTEGTNDAYELYDTTLAPTVESAYDDDEITTFVVGIDIIDELLGTGEPDGIPEANPFERLNEVALAGGAPKNMGMDAEKFFNATNQDELLTAIGGIITDITDCTIDLSTTPEGLPDPIQIPYVIFTANGEEVPPVDDCDTEDGWAWVEEGVIVTFCGSYCDDFKQGAAVFDGTYGCPPAG